MKTKTEKRKFVLTRLEQQFKSGVKTEKKTNKIIPLDEKDIKRIKNEINILNNLVPKSDK